MQELVKALGVFLGRDLFFVLGGVAVLVAFLGLPPKELPTPYAVVLAGFAYVVGFVTQELFSIARVVTTAPIFQPGRFTRWLYYRHRQERWVQPGEFDLEKARERIDEALEATRSRYERIVVLKQLGTTMGSSLIVSGVVVLLRSLWLHHDVGLPEPRCLGAISLGLGCVLLLLSRIQALNQMKVLEIFANRGRPAA